MKKITLILILVLTIASCGRKGALYLPEDKTQTENTKIEDETK